MSDYFSDYRLKTHSQQVKKPPDFYSPVPDRKKAPAAKYDIRQPDRLTDTVIPLSEKLGNAKELFVTSRSLIADAFQTLAQSSCLEAYRRASTEYDEFMSVPCGFSVLDIDAQAAESITFAEFMLLIHSALLSKMPPGDDKELLFAAAHITSRLNFCLKGAEKFNVPRRREDPETAFALRQLLYADTNVYLDFLCDTVSDKSMPKRAENIRRYLNDNPGVYHEGLYDPQVQSMECIGALLQYCVDRVDFAAGRQQGRPYMEGDESGCIYSLLVLPFAEYVKSKGATDTSIRRKIKEYADTAFCD